MLVASDIDNVLSDIIASARRALARDVGIDPHEIILTQVYQRPFSHPDPQINAKLTLDHAFWDRAEVIDGCDPIPGSVDAMMRLHQAGMLVGYITRRPPTVREGTERWMRKHGYPAMPVHHVGTTAFDTTFELCKSSVCHKLGATHLLDDHATEIDTATRSGIEVVVIDADIGRDARHLVLARHPGTLLVADAAAAADLLLDRHSRLAA